jgi:RNA polymerase sigma factor (sigma-70 family)
MSDENSFHDLLARLDQGQCDAQTEVFRRFAERLVKLARSRLDDRIRKTTDPEDVMQSVWNSFFVRQQAGKFALKDWAGLWAVLVVMTVHKCGRRSVAAQRAKRDVTREMNPQSSPPDDSSSGWEAIDRAPSPDEAATLTEMVEYVMAGLDEREQNILSLRLQGFTVPEISEEVGLTERSVHRKLAAIRERATRLEW